MRVTYLVRPWFWDEEAMVEWAQNDVVWILVGKRDSLFF